MINKLQKVNTFALSSGLAMVTESLHLRVLLQFVLEGS